MSDRAFEVDSVFHLIGVDGGQGNGEVHAFAYHAVPDESVDCGQAEFLMVMRYIDTYRRCTDGKWRLPAAISPTT